MSRIISVSRRTDVPAFYGDWFMRRIQEGFAGVVAPYGTKRYLVSLAPQDVDCFVFWSKDCTPFVPHLDALYRLGYRFYFNYTHTALPGVFETDVDKADALETLQGRIKGVRYEWHEDKASDTGKNTFLGPENEVVFMVGWRNFMPFVSGTLYRPGFAAQPAQFKLGRSEASA